jgi:hypothetical protein
MSRYLFRAVVTLNRAAHDDYGREYPSGTHEVMVHAVRLGEPGRDRYFGAVIERADDQSLHSGDYAVVTIRLADGRAAGFFAPGQHFTLWNGAEIGTGVVSREVFTPGSPS